MSDRARWGIFLWELLVILGGLNSPAWAQSSSPSDESLTYLRTDISHAPSAGASGLIAVMRLRKKGKSYEVSGIIWMPGQASRSTMQGSFYPTTGRLAATWVGQPDEWAAIDGVYDKGKDRFNIKTHYGDVVLDRQKYPFLIGFWKWAATSSSGEFVISREDVGKGTFEGHFTGKTPEDTGTIVGDIDGNQVTFKRSGTYKGKHFEQKWSGVLANAGFRIEGEIQQAIPTPWSRKFTAEHFKDLP